MGWSESQTNEALGKLVHATQAKYREAITDVVRQWQADGVVSNATNPKDVAQMLLSLFLGSIAQHALLRDTEPEAMLRGMTAFIAIAQPLRSPHAARVAVRADRRRILIDET